MKRIKMSPDKNWGDLTAREKAPFVIRGSVQFTLLVAALVDIYRRPAEEIRGSVRELHGHRSHRLLCFRTEANLRVAA